MALPKKQSSYWLEGQKSSYPKLSDDIEVDIAIAGGGISGLNIAYLLKEAGFKVAVLEKNTIGSGTTGGTTGKVTVQHGLIYEELLSRFGQKTARHYADISREAFKQTEKIIKKEKINCSWEIKDNYIYTAEPKKIKRFKKEAAAAAKLGLPASFETKLSLPFAVAGAVRFKNQAQFNAYKYTAELAKAVNDNGSYVFENSQVKNIKDGKPCRIKTRNGSVTARRVIVATKIPPGPLLARFSYGAYEYPETSYIVAGKYGSKLKGMYISPDKNHYSLLQTNSDRNSLLLIGGENHIPGLGNSYRRQGKLAKYAQEHFGVSSVKYRWKAMDYIAYDNLPIAGLLYPWSKNVYAISGFKKWGLNLSMAAALTIRDSITLKKNPQAKIFYPHRLSAPSSIPKTILSYLK